MAVLENAFVAGALVGGYIVGAGMTFVVAMFMVCLGGKDKDIWKPFAICLVWPIVPLVVFYDRWRK